MHARALAAPLAMLALAVPGCDTGDEAGPEEQAQAATETFLFSCAHGHVIPAELSLTEPTRVSFIHAGTGLEGCLEVSGFELPGDPSASEIRALFEHAGTTAVRTNGGFAEVVVEARGAKRTFLLETVRGLWLISSTLPAPRA